MNERLKKIRQALGYSQVELAKRLVCKSNLISMWEKGSQAIPGVRIYQICKEFGVRREYLVDGVGEMFETEEPPTAEELLEQAATLLFNELSEKGRQAVLRVMERELGRLGNAEEPEPRRKDSPRKEVRNEIHANAGTINQTVHINQ